MRVLHVQKVKGIGGSERHLLALLPGLRDAGIEVRMWAATTEQGNRFVEELLQRDVQVVSAPAGAHVNPGLARALWVQIRRFRPSIVHTHLVHGDVYGQLAARITGIPAVSSFHGSHSFFRREPVRTAERVAGRFARQTIAISQHVRDFLIRSRLRPPERIRVIPYGIDAIGWRVRPEERVRARAHHGVRDGDVAVGIASRLIPGKGHDVLLEAFAIAQGEAPSLRLLIAGDGPLQHEIEQAARRLTDGTAKMLGFVADIRRFMASCDIVVFPTLPTLGEGFGLAALEAMATACPVIATRVAALPEVVVDGETGMLVPPSDSHSLASALARLATDEALRRQMGAASQRRAADVFGLERMVAATLSAYREIAS